MRTAELWKGRRFLVTGASGFIGSALIARLRTLGAQTAAIVRDADFGRPFFQAAPNELATTRIFTGDIRDYQTCLRAVMQFEPGYVFHLAAVTQVEEAALLPIETFDTNVMGTVNILEAVRQYELLAGGPTVSTIAASSDKAYGRPTTRPLMENSRFDPYHAYDASKASADIIALAYARHYGQKVAVSRMCNVYGPGDVNWRRIIPGTIRSALRGEPIVVRSDGTYRREYLFIEDAVRLYLDMMEKLDGCDSRVMSAAFNFPGEPASVIELVNIINGMANRGSKVHIEDRVQDETPEIVLGSLRANEVFGDYQTVGFGPGLSQTVAWIQHYLTAIGELHAHPTT